MVARHNRLRDIFANFCRRAHLSVRVEVGYGLARDHINSRPADILVQGWDRGKPAAFDVTVTSPLTSVSLNNASASWGQQHMLLNAESMQPMTPGARSWDGYVSP